MGNIIYQIYDNIAAVTLNDPRTCNALSLDTLAELGDIVESQIDKEIRVIVIKGSSDYFASSLMAPITSALETAQQGGAYFDDKLLKHWQRISGCPLPIITGVAGPAIGAGFELALLGDIIIAADNAKFALPEITMGAMAYFASPLRLKKSIGIAKTMDLCLSGRFMQADEAESQGLVSRVVPLKRFEDELMLTAKRVASFPKALTMMMKDRIKDTAFTEESKSYRLGHLAVAKL